MLNPIKIINNIMKIDELLSEKKMSKPTASQCNVAATRLSAVRYSQCVGLGMKAHKTSHTDGTGKQGVKGSGKPLNARKVKSEIHGGPNKVYGVHKQKIRK
jgi:hypothetical protein